jgi:hypothetical protein
MEANTVGRERPYVFRSEKCSEAESKAPNVTGEGSSVLPMKGQRFEHYQRVFRRPFVWDKGRASTERSAISLILLRRMGLHPTSKLSGPGGGILSVMGFLTNYPTVPVQN